MVRSLVREALFDLIFVLRCFLALARGQPKAPDSPRPGLT